jgi:pimeloyl-ACP methyl ester carboxylesterase
VQNHIETERLRDVVLVGHSFGGNVVAVVADKIVDKINRIIFLDAGLPEDGLCIMDQLPHTVAESRISLSRKSSGGLTMPCPSPEALGIFLPEHMAYIQGRLTPHPINTYLSPISMRGPIGSGLPCDFISCTEPRYGSIEPALSRARLAGWSLHEIPTGHDAMITAPHATTDLFERIAAAM